MVLINEISDEPRYNIKSVSQTTGIEPVTIRAWEKRYSLLTPRRAANGYRMYSERDIAMLLWAKTRNESGVSISTAANEFRLLVARGEWPEAAVTGRVLAPARPGAKLLPENVIDQLLYALLHHDEKTARGIFEDALGCFPVIDLFESILVPTLVEIGERWARGEIKVATEHFASGFIQSRLQTIYQSLPLRATAPRVMVGCAPDELHVVGPLMLSILLRDRGYQVDFLGPDVPLDDLADYALEEKPKMLILSATMKDSADRLVSFPAYLQKSSHSSLFGFGGAAFRDDENLIRKINGIYLGPTLRISLDAIADYVPLRGKTRT